MGHHCKDTLFHFVRIFRTAHILRCGNSNGLFANAKGKGLEALTNLAGRFDLCAHPLTLRVGSGIN